MSALFSPIMLRSVALANRIVISPMCQYSADNGQATDWHLMHLGHLAMSGASMLCLEATAVEADGRISPFDLGLWNDETEAALGNVLSFIRKHSRIAMCVQLAHAGRKASSMRPWEGGKLLLPNEGGWHPHAPSAIPQKDGEPAPIELDAAGLHRVRNAFVDSAKRAARLGFDGIELHGAHGYLLHQFLSPISNHRTDEYGGSFENRVRFPLEIFDVVRAVFPSDKPVGIKLSATDWMDGGWNLEQTVALARVLKDRGVDWIDVSSGGVSRAQQIPVGPGYQVPFAAAVRAESGVKTMAVGLITNAHQAEDIIASGKADFVALARGILFDPRWPWHAAAELNAAVEVPPQYWRSQPQKLRGLFGETVLGQR